MFGFETKRKRIAFYSYLIYIYSMSHENENNETNPGVMEEIRCFGCNAFVPNIEGPTHNYVLSAPGCWKLYTDLLAKEYGNYELLKETHRISVDTYSAQHVGNPDDRRAVQSVNIHLVALYLKIEMKLDNHRIVTKMQELLNRGREFKKLDPPDFAGTLNISDAAKAKTFEDHIKLVDRWSISVWSAWDRYHDYIRNLAGYASAN
jgi:hypothetical protein